MTGRKGNSEFCFRETLSWPRETLRSRGNKTHCFPPDKCFAIYISQLKNRKNIKKKNWEEIVCLTQAGSRVSLALKEHGLITCESKVHSCCFPRELVIIVNPRELVSFDPRQVTRSPPIGKRI